MSLIYVQHLENVKLKWINSVRFICSKFDAFILLENLNMLFIYVQHLESVKCLNDLEIYDLWKIV